MKRSASATPNATAIFARETLDGGCFPRSSSATRAWLTPAFVARPRCVSFRKLRCSARSFGSNIDSIPASIRHVARPDLHPGRAYAARSARRRRRVPRAADESVLALPVSPLRPALPLTFTELSAAAPRAQGVTQNGLDYLDPRRPHEVLRARHDGEQGRLERRNAIWMFSSASNCANALCELYAATRPSLNQREQVLAMAAEGTGVIVSPSTSLNAPNGRGE